MQRLFFTSTVLFLLCLSAASAQSSSLPPSLPEAATTKPDVVAAQGITLDQTKILISVLKEVKSPRMDALAEELAAGKVGVITSLTLGFTLNEIDDTIYSFRDLTNGLLRQKKTLYLTEEFFKTPTCGQKFVLSTVDVFQDFVDLVSQNPADLALLRKFSSPAKLLSPTNDEKKQLYRLVEQYEVVMKKHSADLPALLLDCQSVAQILDTSIDPKTPEGKKTLVEKAHERIEMFSTLLRGLIGLVE